MRQRISEDRVGSPGSSAPQPGADLSSAVLERFTVVDALPEVELGRAFRATVRTTGQEVLLRVLPAPTEGEAGDVGRAEVLLLQASLFARLRHPNTPRLVDFGLTTLSGASAVFLATEWTPGRTLTDALRQGGPMELRRALRVALGVCRSLEEAHHTSLVHGDLRPGHIVLGHHGGSEAIVLGGWCEAAAIDEQFSASDQNVGVTGAAAYRAPEVIRRLDVDGRADLYALGALLYLMVTGQAPFARETVMGTLMAHLLEPVPSPSDRGGPELPEAVSALILRCMEKNPRDRYPNASALREALEAALLSLPALSAAPREPALAIAEVDVLGGVRGLGDAPITSIGGEAEPEARPVEALARRQGARETGCLTVHVSDRVEYRVFLMQGDIVAVHGPADSLGTLRRLVSGGLLPNQRLNPLVNAIAEGSSLDIALAGEVSDATLEDAMRHQLRQNLLNVTTLSQGRARWEALAAVVAPDFAGLADAAALVAAAAQPMITAQPAPQALVAAASPSPVADGPGSGGSAPSRPPESAPPPPPTEASAPRRGWVPWLVAAVALLTALWFGLRGDGAPVSAPVEATAAPVEARAAPAAPIPPAAPPVASPAPPMAEEPPAAAAAAPTPARQAASAAAPRSAGRTSKETGAARATTPATSTPAATPAAATSEPAAAEPARAAPTGRDLKDPFAASRGSP